MISASEARKQSELNNLVVQENDYRKLELIMDSKIKEAIEKGKREACHCWMKLIVDSRILNRYHQLGYATSFQSGIFRVSW